MGIFNDLLFVSDIDGTLINNNREISSKNMEAIDYFCSEGGIFSLASGRSVDSIKRYYDMLDCNCPIICANGAGVYDYAQKRFLWEAPLDGEAVKVLKYVDEMLPHVGIEIFKGTDVYFCKINDIVSKHIENEHLPVLTADYNTLPLPWGKALFAQKSSELEHTREVLNSSPFKDQYIFLQSADVYFEVLSKNASKGAALSFIADRLNIKRENTIAVGDNENDISMLKYAGLSFAVNSATDLTKKAADIVVSDNNNDPIYDIVEILKQKYR